LVISETGLELGRRHADAGDVGVARSLVIGACGIVEQFRFREAFAQHGLGVLAAFRYG